MSTKRPEVPYGTLDLLVLKTLESMGPLNGYRIARRIEQLSENLLELNQGSIYPALLRLGQKGWIKAKWGVSETKRKVKIYTLTRSGRRQLKSGVEDWEKTTALVARMLEVNS
jgi:transcriptional regulator